MAADNIEASLEPGLIIRMSPGEYISHLRAIVATAPADQHDAAVAAIASKLQSHVHSNAIPPALFTMWLPMVLPHSPKLLKDVLSDKESSGVRRGGRRQLCRAIRSRSWSDNDWEALGGVESVRSLVNSLSISEVHPLVSAMATGARSRGVAGDVAVDHLLEALTDGRSQMKQLEMVDIAHLLTACSTPFIIEWLSKEPMPSFPSSLVFKSLMRCRMDLARNIATGAVTVHPDIRSSLLAKLPVELIWSREPYTPKYTPVNLSPESLPGTRFCLDLLYSFQAEQNFKKCSSSESILDFVDVAKKHAIRHETPFDDILPLLQTGLATAALQEKKMKYTMVHPHVLALLRYWSISKYPDYVSDCSIDHKKHPLSAQWHPSRPNAKHEKALEELLVLIIKSVPENSIQPGKVSNTMLVLQWHQQNRDFAPTAILPLLKLLCRHASTVLVDLDSPKLTVEDWERINLNAQLLFSMPSCDSKWLFSRLPDMPAAVDLINFIHRTRPYMAATFSELPQWFKHGLLKTMWEADDAHSEDGFPETLIFMEKVKKEAEQCRDPHTRSSLAMEAALLAQRSKNVGILRDVTVWSKRFKRDHIVYPEITRILVSSRSGPLLSCVKIPPNRRPTSISALKALVEETHSVLSLYIEAALLYLREPSFVKHGVYDNFSTLLQDIFEHRVNALQALRKSGLGSETELMSILIEPMMPILMRYEETGLADGNEPLAWNIPNGPLGKDARFKSCRLFVLPFFDKLARRRDELWAQERLKRDDVVATLDEGWPRGLPIQCLVPEEQWVVQAVANPDAAPFIADRARKIVFRDAETALAPVPRNTDVIGLFVDSLKVAIRSYVGRGKPTEVLARIQHVWEHYSNVVPATAGHIELIKSLLRSTASAAEVKWPEENVLPSALPSFPVSKNHGTGLEPVEWDPRTNGDGCDEEITETNVYEKPRNLLLCRLSASDNVPNWKWQSHSFNEPVNWSPSKPGNPQQSFWRTWVDEARKLPLSSKDAVVASAMLYLDAFTAASTRLLSNQFPAGAVRPRYPPMYLNYEFLSNAGKSSNTRIYINDAIISLKKLKSVIPPLLLRDLANSMLDKLIGMGDHEKTYQLLESATFKIISLLSHTDQPHLASDLGLKVIEKMPDSSSWHRRVISVGLFKRLTSTQAEEMVQKFSHFVINSLQMQHESQKTDKEHVLPDGEDSPKAKYAKVTTIKLLAELLENGNLVSDEISVGILRSLFVTSNHIDVKTAALSAIRELLAKSVRLGLEPNLTIYNIFCSFADAAAGPDERLVVSEAEWLAAENGGPLPKCNDERPLLELFFTAEHIIPDKLQEDYFHNVLLRILNESISQHTRWMRIFLSKFKISAEEASVAYRTPFSNDLSDKLLSYWPSHNLKGHLLLLRDLSMGYRDCERFARIDKKLKARDPTFGETNAGEHWRHYLRTRMDYKVAFVQLSYIVTYASFQSPSGISREDAEEEYLQRVAITAREPRYYLNGDPIVSLRPFEFAVDQLLIHWDPKKSSLPEPRRRLLERIVADVSDLHTKTWPDGSSKKPPLLPSLWKLRCTLATTFPLEELVERVISLCEECAQSTFAMGYYERLTIAVKTISSDSQVFLLVKLGEAAQNQHDSFAGCIKVQLAHHLLREIYHIGNVERHAEVESLLKSWLHSSNEIIRRVAFSEMERLATTIKGNNISPSRFGYGCDSEGGYGYDDNCEDGD